MIDHRSKPLGTSGRVKSRGLTPKQKHEQRNTRLHAEKLAREKAGIKAKPQQSSKSFNQPAYIPGMKAEFYSTREWRELRFKVLRSSDGKCVYCGRSRKQHGVTIHIDHIKPRSKFPHLELDINNLQVTCEDCNIGKGATVI